MLSTREYDMLLYAMSPPKSLKDLLNSGTLFGDQEKTRKYVKHEFQDYAYRLASDLGDLSHKTIFMRLAKTTPRYMMDQAAQFALEYFKEPNKGKLFMWKLADLRYQEELKKKMLNKELQFVLAEMGKLYDGLKTETVVKFKQAFDTDAQADLALFAQKLPAAGRRPAAKILVLGTMLGAEADLLAKLGYKLLVWDISQVVVAETKKYLARSKFELKLEVKRELDLAKISGLKDLAGIWLGHVWQYVPLAAEKEVLTWCQQALRPGGVMCVQAQFADAAVAEWELFEYKEKNYIRFSKKDTWADLKQLLGTSAVKLKQSVLIQNPAN